MATNEIFADGYKLSVAVSDPASPLSGGPVRFANITGVALTDKGAGGNAAANTSVDFGPGVWNLSVKGANDAGNSAVAVGDAIFYVDADTPKLSKKISGYFFGFALQTVTSGATATVQVAHVPPFHSVGALNLPAGVVGTSQLAANAVSAAKLSSTMATGYIPIDLAAARILAANDIPALAGTPASGISAKDTVPIFERVNGATDKALRLKWAATSVIQLQFPTLVLPPDYDNASPLLVKLMAKMSGATDTPVIAVSAFVGVGGANIGGNTGALSNAIQTLSSSLAGASVGAPPNFLSLSLTPAAHGTDALELYAAWAEYTRK